MAGLKGSKTEANLKTAFAGESQVRGKYHYFAGKAREEGYEAVARYFEEAAVNEQEHAKIWFKLLSGINSTKDNLGAAIEGEAAESNDMYPGFAKTAMEEGFEDIAKMFENVAKIEKNHEEYFRLLLYKIDEGPPPLSASKWKCNNCGNVVNAKSAPNTCPVCNHADIPWSASKAYRKWED